MLFLEPAQRHNRNGPCLRRGTGREKVALLCVLLHAVRCFAQPHLGPWKCGFGPSSIDMQEWKAGLRSESKRVLIMRIMGGNRVLAIGLSCDLAANQTQTVSNSCKKFLSLYRRGWLTAVTCYEEPLLHVVSLLSIDQWFSICRPLTKGSPRVWFFLHAIT